MKGLEFADALHRMVAYQALSELFAGRRVLEIGCGDGLGLRQLFALGAAHVVGVDRDVRSARRQVRGLGDPVTVRAVRPPRLALGAERFDCIVVVDVAEMAPWDAWLETLRAHLAPGGVLLLRALSADGEAAESAPDEGALHYGDLLDLVEPHFSAVRVFGQAPFVGGSVVALEEDAGDEALDLSLDLSLLGGEAEPISTYLLLCSDGPLPPNLDVGFSVVQVPSAGEEGLAHWWDAAGSLPPSPPDAAKDASEGRLGAAPEDATPSTGIPESAGTPAAEQEAAADTHRRPDPLPGEPDPGAAPPAEKAVGTASAPQHTPGPSADLSAYLDGAGGRVRRWSRPPR